MLSKLQFVDLETSADPICAIFYIFCFATICEIKKNLPRNALQRREQRSPGKETCGCTPMDMTALNKIDHVGEQPTTQPYKRNMYTDNLKKGPPKQKACNTRSMDTTALNQIHHVEEQPSTQYYNRNMHKNDKKQRPRNEKVWNTRPINTTGHNELHHLEEQPTAQSYNTNVHTNDQKQQRQRQAQEQLDEQIQRRADEIFRQSQHEGQVCKLNCVPLAIRWICNNKTEVKIPGCACQLEKIITVDVDRNKKLVDEDLQCGYFMETLVNDQIVNGVANYIIADEIMDVQITAAWEKLMTMNGSVAIFATFFERGVPGHVVVYDLDTRTERTKNGKVMMCDPQDTKNERNQEIDFQKFKKQVVGCDELRLYSVNLEKLCEIIVKYKNCLHHIEETIDNAPLKN